MATELWAIGLVLLASFIGSFGPIYLKKASGEFTFNILKLIKNKELIFGVIFYGLGTVLFWPALRGGELSVLYPIVSTVYIWVTLWSVTLLKEKMSSKKWIGLVFIILGVVFIGFGA